MPDWDDLRFFLALAREGTLSGAARVLGVSQPTAGRRLAAFERRLGARLVHRRASGQTLTAAGTAMVAHAERMELEALAAERGVAGQDSGIRGAVRITASEWLVVRILGPLMGALADRHPGLAIDLAADPRHLNLGRREADLALRPSRFEHASVYQREVARVGFGLYGSARYLAHRGAPDLARQCDGQAIIVMHDDVGDVARGWIAASAAKARVVGRTNGREAMATMAAAGLGLACLPRVVGDATPGLRAVAVSRPLPVRQLWLGVHRDTRETPRVRAVSRFLVDALRRAAPSLDPPA